MVSEEAVSLTTSIDMGVLECNSSSMDFVIDDMDITWFSVSESRLNFVNVSNCTGEVSGSGSGSGSDDMGSNTNGNFDNMLPEGLNILQNQSSIYMPSTIDLPNGGYVICVVNSTNLGRCSSNFTTVTGTVCNN